jgi:hypothetical protein
MNPNKKRREAINLRKQKQNEASKKAEKEIIELSAKLSGEERGKAIKKLCAAIENKEWP